MPGPRRVYQMFVLRDDSHEHSVSALLALRQQIGPLNRAGAWFKIVAIGADEVGQSAAALEDMGITSLPALAVGGDAPQVVAVGAQGIGRFLQDQAQEPEEAPEDFHNWVHERIGSAAGTRGSRAAMGYDEGDEEALSGGLGNRELSSRMEDYQQQRAALGMPAPADESDQMFAEPARRRSSRRHREPRQEPRQEPRPARAPAPHPGHAPNDDGIGSALAHSNMDKREAKMLKGLYENLQTS